jgi:hypothetical protein
MIQEGKVGLREMQQSLRCIILPPAPQQPLARRPQRVRPILRRLSPSPQKLPRPISRLRRPLQRNLLPSLRQLQEMGVRPNELGLESVLGV